MAINKKKQIVVVMRGPSAVLFRQKKSITIKDFQSSIGPVNINYSTRWLKRDNGIAVPGHIWIEITGVAPNLEKALVPFANAGLSMLPILSFCANAAIGDPQVEIGFDNTKGSSDRDYFQCYVAPEPNEIYIGRHINIESTVKFIELMSKHSDSERLRRAINQYRLSLDHWRLGRETMSMAHLWMALEAITKVKIRQEIRQRELATQEALADEFGIDLKKLDSYVRKDVLLKGDSECYKKAKKASDGFEHGFLGFEKIIELSKDIRSRMAKHIRIAIFEICELEKETYIILNSDPFDKPLGHWPVVKYLRGKLIGEGNELSKNGNAYPFMKWKPTIKGTKITKGGKFNITIGDTFTAELAEGIEFQLSSLEAWQAG